MIIRSFDLEQFREHVVTELAGNRDWRPVAVGLGVHVGAFLQQQRRHERVSLRCGEMLTSEKQKQKQNKVIFSINNFKHTHMNIYTHAHTAQHNTFFCTVGIPTA